MTDRKKIIFFCVDYNGDVSPGVMLYVIKSDGSNYPNFPKGYNELILDKVSGDVNGDGYLDIVMRMTNTVDVIDRFGNHLPGFPVNYSDGDIGPFKPVNIYDLDNDGLLEIIVCKNNESVVFNSNGTIRNGWPQNYSGICRTNAAIGDIDNDGMAEIVVPVYTSDPVPVFRIFRQNGELFSQNWNFTYDLLTNWGASPSLILKPK
ncbi:MAG: VCBS repeat-containing protein [Ignavibacteria bacterium]|nr:VCBS repeat-containing protein [Ignavibacteria bacterium]